MSCGNTLSVFQEDPQDMPGQGLARTDNYSDVSTAQKYSGLTKTFTDAETQQRILDFESRFKPQYIDQSLANTNRALGGTLDTVGQYLPQLDTLRRSTDPAAAALTDLLLQQATSDVQAGSSMNAGQLRSAQQASRAAMAARGMNGTNAAVADEILRQFDLGENLKQSRRQFAMNALGLNQQLNAGWTPQSWLQFAQGAGNAAAPTLLPVGAQIDWLSQIYGQNEANNRAQAQLETAIGQQQAEIWNDWGKTATGASIGGGGGGGSKQFTGGQAGGSTGSGFGMGNSGAGWNSGGSYGSFGRGIY